MWDPLAVINAVEGDSAFYMSERGWVELTPKGETISRRILTATAATRSRATPGGTI